MSAVWFFVLSVAASAFSFSFLFSFFCVPLCLSFRPRFFSSFRFPSSFHVLTPAVSLVSVAVVVSLVDLFFFLFFFVFFFFVFFFFRLGRIGFH